MTQNTESIVSGVEARLDAVAAMLPELEEKLIDMQWGELEIDRKSTEVDLVTQADHASESRLLAFIRDQFPEDGIVTEEGGQSGQEREREMGFRWVLDPIDGTVNYANRLPLWVISIGILHGSERWGGLVNAPVLRERFRAIRGHGATRNGDPISVQGGSKLRQGLVATGFPYDRAERAEPLSRALANMLRASGGVRRLGAAALDFCYVADGRFIGYYEMGLKAWDSAAGSLIAEEAGARITDLAGKPYDIFASNAVLVSNGKTHEALREAAAPLQEAVAIQVD